MAWYSHNVTVIVPVHIHLDVCADDDGVIGEDSGRVAAAVALLRELLDLVMDVRGGALRDVFDVDPLGEARAEAED